MNYYDILEVREDASFEVIAMAYKALCKKYHPDVCPEKLRGQATEIMKEINLAYETLSNPDKRAAYDYKLRSGRNSSHYSNSSNTHNTYNSYTESTKQNKKSESKTKENTSSNSQNNSSFKGYEEMAIELENTKNTNKILACFVFVFFVLAAGFGLSLYDMEVEAELNAPVSVYSNDSYIEGFTYKSGSYSDGYLYGYDTGKDEGYYKGYTDGYYDAMDYYEKH